jgi:polyisoprenoid-binding protein YceI
LPAPCCCKPQLPWQRKRCCKKEQCGADGTAQIKRSEFGMTNMASAGDKIKILFQIEAYKD